MRLINVKTLELSEFFGDDIPHYAILSHRWESEEVGIEVFSHDLAKARTLRGFIKIQYCAEQADREGLTWCWVDTCCIDKRSSSELSEAINSMYQWYKNAVCCYAYLGDVSLIPSETPLGSSVNDFENRNLHKSEWFLRGWTLQELIAPRTLRFYSRDWTDMGSRQMHSGAISRLCGIDERVLLGHLSVDSVNIAQRMRWASARKTTRIEDTAYCLMGIFDVNMPLLYGEGRKAFMRLQEEIIKRSADHSIFTWIDRNASRLAFRSLFARSPAEFQHCQNIESLPASVPFALTNMGLKMSLGLNLLDGDDSDGFEYLAELQCAFKHSGEKIAIRLRRTAHNTQQFVRVDPYKLYEVDWVDQAPDLYVPEKMPITLMTGNRIAGFKCTISTVDSDLEGVRPDGVWHEESSMIRYDPHSSLPCFIARLLFTNRFDKDKRRLVTLVYNLRSYPITIAAGSLDVQDHEVLPSSYASFVRIPTTAYNMDDPPSMDTVDWTSTTTQSHSFVELGKDLINDELVITAQIHVNTSDHDKRYTISDDTNRVAWAARREEKLLSRSGTLERRKPPADLSRSGTLRMEEPE